MTGPMLGGVTGKRDWVRVLLVAALAVLIAGAVFTAVVTEIWPSGHWAPWIQRVSSGGLLAGVLLTATAGSVWAARRRRG